MAPFENRPRRTVFLVAFVIACVMVLLAPPSAMATPILTVDPTPLASGQLHVEINVSGAVDVYGYQFSVEYDPSVLAVADPFNPATEGTFFSSVYPDPGETFFFPGLDDGLGHITFIANTLVGPLAGVTGSGSLASIDFTRLSDDPTTVVAFLDEANGDGFVVSEVTSVPEPATMLLVATGSAFVMRRRARRRRHL